MPFSPRQMVQRPRRESEGSAALLVLVDRRGSYTDTSIVEATILVALEHYKLPYRLHDLADGPVTTEALGNCAAVLIAQSRLGHALSADETEALDTGADDFLRKPFSHLVLVARLQALLRRGRKERPVEMSAGDLRFDPTQRRCRRADTDIELTAREFSVLEYLMANAGAVVSKREILDHVWDYDFEGAPNIVEVYVRHLRTKIDLPFGKASIETVRGAGYRLRENGG